MNIHPTAVVDSNATIADSVQIGPYTVIGPHVSIAEGCEIGSHCVITGYTTIGCNNTIYSHAAIGGNPQDKKYKGEPTTLVIGDNNTIREFCTINTGTMQGGGVTVVGHHNWIMAYVHIAHDCRLGHNNVIANSVQLAGHVTIGNWVILGGLTGVHQFIQIGDHSMTAFQTKLTQDLPPYVMGAGYPASASGINTEGLKRRGFSAQTITAIKRAYKILYRQGLSLEEAKLAIAHLQAEAKEDEIIQALKILQSFLNQVNRGIVR